MIFTLVVIMDGFVNIDGQEQTLINASATLSEYNDFRDSRRSSEKKSFKESETWVGCQLQWQAVMQLLMQALLAMDATFGSVGMTMEIILKNEMWLLFSLEMDLLLSKMTNFK